MPELPMSWALWHLRLAGAWPLKYFSVWSFQSSMDMNTAANRILIALALAWTASASIRPCAAELIGSDEFLISLTPGGWFPDVAYNGLNGNYLVVWPDYAFGTPRVSGRFVTSAGAVSGPVFLISDASGGFFPAVAYNAADNEFLVTWDDQRPGFAIWGQRIRGSDGVLLGPNFQIGQTGGIRSAVAWNATHNVYLVTWWGGSPSEISARRLSGAGALLGVQLNISNDPHFSGYPSVTADNADQFLVAWDFSSADDIGYIHAQRVSAVTGANNGAVIPVSTNGNRSCIAFDPGNSRWLVQYNQGNPGQSYDQYGRFVTTAGATVGGEFGIAATQGFEGDTQFGGDVAFLPGPGRYLSSFGTDSGMGCIESLASGTKITPQTVVLGTGSYTSVNNAADPASNQFLTVWDGTATTSGHYVWGRLFAPTDLIPPDPVQSFTALPGSQAVRLSWTNPNTADFTGTTIRIKAGSVPTGPTDGQLLVEKSNAPGSSDSYLHTGLTGGTTYYYAAFAHDARPNHAAGLTASAVAATLGDFEPDGDVDQSDFALLQRCFSGDALPYPAGCTEMDVDFDGDVDQSDFGDFLPCLTGPDMPSACE